MKNSVVVTGNMGYLGPIVVRKLHQAGYVVAGVDPNIYEAELPFEYRADIQVPGIEQLPRIFWDCKSVVHLAAISNDPMGELDESLTYQTNVRLVAELCDAFPEARHVLASSASVYGFSDLNCIESDPLNPLSTYASSKIAAEKIVNLLNPSSISLRFGTLWGASPNFRVDLMVNHFVLEGLVDKVIAPTSNSRRPILHVSDAAKAIVDAVDSNPEHYHGVYNVTGENVNVYEVASKIAAFMNVDVKLDPDKSDADKRSYHAATMREPHFSSGTAIKVGDETHMNQLITCAGANLKAPPRIEALKRLLAERSATVYD